MKKLIYSVLGKYLNLTATVAPSLAAKHGYKILCYPLKSPVKPHHYEFLNSSEKSQLNYRGNKIQTYKWGNGPKKILFLHGWQSHSFRWKNYIKEFSFDEYTLYALDAPAHGLSTGKLLHVPLYSEVIEQFIKNTGAFDTIVGHSMGSFSMLNSLHNHPDLPVDQLVIMGVPGEAMDFIWEYKRILNISDKAMRLTQEKFEQMIGKSLLSYKTEIFASKISKRGLIIHDKNDRETPYHNAVKIKNAWNNSELITTEGLDHNLKSDLIVKAVKNFITKQNEIVITGKTQAIDDSSPGNKIFQ